jgi:hypothetical protein
VLSGAGTLLDHASTLSGGDEPFVFVLAYLLNQVTGVYAFQHNGRSPPHATDRDRSGEMVSGIIQGSTSSSF